MFFFFLLPIPTFMCVLLVACTTAKTLMQPTQRSPGNVGKCFSGTVPCSGSLTDILRIFSIPSVALAVALDHDGLAGCG